MEQVNGMTNKMDMIHTGKAMTQHAMPTIRTLHNNCKHYHPPTQQHQQNAQQYTDVTSHSTVIPPGKSMTTAFINEAHSNTDAEIMIESGEATHVCPAWFAQDSPLYTLQQGQGRV